MNSIGRNCASIGRSCCFYTMQWNQVPTGRLNGKSALNRLKTVHDYKIISYRCNYSINLGLSNFIGGYSSRYTNKNGLWCQSSALSRVPLYSTSQPPSQLLSGNIRLYSSDEKHPDEDTKKLSLFQKFRKMYRDYWYVLIPVHCTTSCFWFGGSYLLAKSGIDVVSLLEFLHISESLITPFRNGNGAKHVGLLAVALALYKIATPLRYAVTLGGTTVSINYLKKFGYIKPMPRKEILKEMYREKKDILLEKKEQLRENVMHHLEKRHPVTGECMGPLEKAQRLRENLRKKGVVSENLKKPQTFKQED